ncbi:FAD/NAD(P)-binding domain-containing protein [Myriangium duriaei CBS 260.36]|uniref:FAD/NAD(P)-binding domain-containing protein n=1 Tax=Myriangium duriaei CBS 260.36 TaxID=1168546 RepID=A0A9P4MIS8_9PEZI|nr:FAD/NAD(P)-binding domain-containing protein [Myriangium duriaei CBS 260.36]
MPLRITIAGAGIAGLTAAIALAPSNHTITIVEKSSFATEIGAAIHLNPPAVRILSRLGVNIAAMRPVVCERWCQADAETLAVHKTRFVLREKQARLGIKEDEIAVHRVDAHNVLKEKALSFASVRLVLGGEIHNVDTVSGTVTLADGSTIEADVVIGADGVHSRTVTSVDSQVVHAKPAGVNMYRWLVKIAEARKDPELAVWMDKMGLPSTHYTLGLADTKHFLVCYPCRDGELLNCATLQPATEDKEELSGENHHFPDTVEEVVHLMRAWPKQYSALARLGMDVKRWSLLTRDVPKAYNKNRLVLIGDAAHPCHPTYGIGANLGIEDAGVLGMVLDPEVNTAAVTSRLDLFNDLRYERTAMIKRKSEMVPNFRSNDTNNVAKQLRSAAFADVSLSMEDFAWPFDAVSEAQTAVVQFVVG